MNARICSRFIGLSCSMLMINPQHAYSPSLQAHLVLETQCGFRLILYWIRLELGSNAAPMLK